MMSDRDDGADDFVIDDQTQRLEALAWACERFMEGDDGDDLQQELVARGWDADDAYMLCETARKQTQAQRGVRTYADAINTARRRRVLQHGWVISMPTIAAARQLIQAIARWRSFKRR
jgi:phage tail protein X